ncbi:MAG: hypothetical protein KGL58_05845, partial [Pseudomonadota bacterium]|nr:hypothetical protein [Pseudomonadota bacterium]
MTRPDILNRQRVREEIAVCAARLIAEDGIGDFSVAKRKAAKMIGAPERSLPNNSEVEEALRIYYGLYQSQEHVAHLKYLRAIALDMMNWLSVFNPQLVGLVLSGFASRHTSINLEMFADSPKDVEIFFLNENRPYFMKEKKVILREH